MADFSWCFLENDECEYTERDSWKNCSPDWRNEQEERNQNNTETWAYNCGGYALGIYSWYRPYDVGVADEIANALELDENIDDIIHDLFISTRDHILVEFPNLRLIKKEDIDKYDSVIAYRVGISQYSTYDHVDWDFHFRLYKDGKWTEKAGGLPISECEFDPLEEIQWECEDDDELVYTGEIALFAKVD